MVEQKRGIFQSAVEGIKSLTGKHKQQDILNAQRLLAERITQEDREGYKTDMARRIMEVYSVMIRTIDPTGFSGLLPLACTTMVQELENLPDEEINKRIRQQAAKKLARWQQENPSLEASVVNTQPNN